MLDYPDLSSQHILIEFHVLERMVNNSEQNPTDILTVIIHQLQEIVNLSAQQIFKTMRQLVILEIFYFHHILNQMMEIQR